MKKLNLLATVILCMTTTITSYAQEEEEPPALKVAGDYIDINYRTTLYNLGQWDGLGIITKYSTKVLESGSDLIWGSFYQAQPNNPGIFTLTSVGSPAGWGPCFTVRANGRTGIMNDNPSAALEIGSASSIQQVKVNGNIIWSSDARMKNNIKDISNSLEHLKQLRGVSYTLKEEQKEEAIPEKILRDPDIDVEKINATLEKSSKEANPLLSRNYYGFLAQEVQETFPDLVYQDDSTGLLAIDYIGFIPVLVDGLTEQQNQIEQQQTRIEQLQNQIEQQKEQIASILKVVTQGKGAGYLGEAIESVPLLYQNAPNPFNQSTEIRFYLPRDVQNAHLYVSDVNGLRKKDYPLQIRESGSVTLSASMLEAGTYFYTLVCDGNPIDTKQMVLTK